MKALTESEKRRRCVALTTTIVISIISLFCLIPRSIQNSAFFYTQDFSYQSANNLYSVSTLILFLVIGLAILIANIVIWRNEKTNAS